MDSGASSASVVGMVKKGEKTRRSWTPREEECLIQSLKDVILKGWKSENGFKAGYLTLLENAMHQALPGCTLRGNPHINSKIHVWKKTYGALVTILSRSGVGWNESNHTIDANDETWESIVNADPTLRTMRHKQWTLYDDWCEIFGNDRATGDQSKNFQHALHEVLQLDTEVPIDFLNADIPPLNLPTGFDDSVSETNTPSSKPTTGVTSKSKKRKQSTDVDDSIVTAINNLAHITKDTMGELIKELAAVEKISVTQDKVLEALEGINEFTEDEKVVAAKLLFNNHNDLALFQRLGEKGRISLLNNLLHGP